MKNSIEELKGYEKNIYANIVTNYNIENENSIAKTFRKKLEEKKQTIRMIKQQIKFLNSESLDLTSEISRLISEIELKRIYER